MHGACGRFPRSHRLLRPAEFQRIFKGEPCRYTTAYFTMLALPNNQGHPRLGVALTKRHVKLAVERNRIRRQLRESFRLHQNSLDGLDVVVLGRAGIDQVTSQELRVVLDRGWDNLAKRCKKS